ncbi:hypothetical protein GCM10027615_74120 [Plantactinospora veratri]
MAGGAVDPEEPAALGRVAALVQVLTLGELRPTAEFLHVLRQLGRLVVGEDRGFSSAWTSCRASGIRPVPTWNSTEAAPTPIRLGPRPSTPWALRP